MVEIQLLKKLDHPNIVKYQGFVRTSKNVSIVLEYCENGSLANMCKKYGKIPEHVAALYVEDVLEGLVYLHDQGIIHRDIKGANLLISAEGIIKLADFGVATSTKLDGNCTVVGTPHWMAPEIIEMKGALSATDIWSLGCTVVELLTGHPPYYEKPQMATAFAIVTEDQPPIPDGISDTAVDFLHLCFFKEPKMRATAKRLLKHRWITSTKEPRESASSSIKFDDAVKSVKDWNAAMKRQKSDPQSIKMSINSFNNFKDKIELVPGHPVTLAIPKSIHNHHSNNTNVLKQRQNSTGHETTKLQHNSSKTTHFKEYADEESWNNNFPDFPEDFSSKIEAYLQKTSRQQKNGNPASFISTSLLPTKWQSNHENILNENSPHREQVKDDYTFSDLEGEIDVSKLLQLHAKNNINNINNSRSDRNKMNRQHESYSRQKRPNNTPSSHQQHQHHHQQQYSHQRNDDHLTNSPVPKHTRTLKSYCEDDNEDDWSKDFSSNEPSSHQSKAREQFQHSETSIPQRSRQSSEDHQEQPHNGQMLTNFAIGTAVSSTTSSDSFDAEIEEAFDHNSLGSEDQLNLRVLANANTEVQKIATEMRSMSLSSQKLSHHLNSLVSILGLYPKTQTSLAKSNPLISLVHILKTNQEEPAIVEKTLDVLCILLGTSSLVIQKFCLLGGVPSVLQLADYHNPLSVRYKTSLLIEKLFEAGKFATDIILSSGGIAKLAQFIKEDFEDSDRSQLVEVGIKGIFSIFKVQGKSMISELGYQLSQHHILGPLVFALGHFFRLRQEASAIATDEGTAAAVARVNNVSDIIDKLLYIFVIFSKMDDYVRDNMLESALFVELFRLIKRMEPNQQVQLLKFFQSTSTTPQGVATLLKAAAFRYFFSFLKKVKTTAGSKSRQYLIMGEHIFPTVQNMCVMMPVYSKHRIGELIEAGAVPFLRDAAHASSPLKEYAIDILFKIVTVRYRSSVGKTLLRDGILQLFLEYVVESSDWQPSAYDAISTWLENDLSTLEPVLAEAHVSKTLVHGLSVASIDTVFEHFLKMILASARLCNSVAGCRELWSIVQERLQTDGPINRLMLLKIVRAILDNANSRDTAYSFCRELGVKQVIEILAEKEPKVLAKALSNDILRIYFSTNKHAADESNYSISRHNSVSSCTSNGSSSNTSIGGSSTISMSALMLQNQQTPSLLPTSTSFSNIANNANNSNTQNIAPSSSNNSFNNPNISTTSNNSNSSSSSNSKFKPSILRQRAASFSRSQKPAMPINGTSTGGSNVSTPDNKKPTISRSQSHRRHRSAATSSSLKRLSVQMH